MKKLSQFSNVFMDDIADLVTDAAIYDELVDIYDNFEFTQ